MTQIDINLFLCHPVRKVLVPINQSCYLICFCYNFFNRAKGTNMYEINLRRLSFAGADLCYFSSIIFKNITVFLRKATLSKKCYSQGKNRLYWCRWHWKLEDSPRLVFINEQCGNLIVVNDGGEVTKNISWRKSNVLL